jgi:hypothetical protein
MKSVDRSTLVLAVILIAIGLAFLALNLIPGMDLRTTWPVILFVVAAGFFLPAVLWPSARRGLAGLFIPGAIVAAVGVVLTYNTLSGDWAAWGYAWTLIVAGVGLGLILSAWGGGWGRGTAVVGAWLLGSSLAVFSIFAAIFGGPLLKAAGPLFLILLGGWLLLRSWRRS